MRITRILPLAALFALPACGDPGTELASTSTFRVTVVGVNGGSPPLAEAPLPANRGDVDETWDFEIDARSPYGQPVPFEGMVRVSVEPGTVVALEGDGAIGRNILVSGGKAKGQARVTAVYGPARLWVEDLGYVPVPISTTPACSNGRDDDDDVLIDFPADPGCAFADDDDESSGSFSAGISPPVHYELPRIGDVQGEGSQTPYPYEAVEINASRPKPLVVTRVASDGFYVTDLTDQDKGHNHIFAFNFSTPPGMRVCDRVTFLSGTISEFFGFTELSFPSYRLEYPGEKDTCEVPEPAVLTDAMIGNPNEMEKLESGLVRIEGFVVAKKFGPKPVVNNIPDAEHSNCDLNGDGQVDFENAIEGSCANVCSGDPECTEWTSFSARGNYKVYNPSTLVQIQVQTGTAASFDPTAWKGKLLKSVTGTLRNFSGGSLNWTIETRCPDDLVCDGNPACVSSKIPSSKACVRLRTIGDNDQETN
ncbi:hypothetical protein [Polyangium aurulentum]|uniref:hypothetical protein n=1 Tax=Polyangium aurulentum TaxID=2567896 RepID=UPI0010AE7469|nr:hypothetical protein [Polyangium aurulentum]UQA63347.1 hypothetical protein E8A73_023920 [Polyangium aurulentum]